MTPVKFIIRDFLADKLKEYENFLKKLVDEAVAAFPGSKADFEVIEQYRNMVYILNEHPQVEEYAIEALKKLNVTPFRTAIRGGTDGSRLCYMGIPTPNLFAGGHNFHALTEFVAVQDMEMATQMIVTLAQVWEEKA